MIKLLFFFPSLLVLATLALAASTPLLPRFSRPQLSSLFKRQGDSDVGTPDEPITILPAGAGVCPACDNWTVDFGVCLQSMESNIDVTYRQTVGCLCNEAPWAQLVACNECVLAHPESQTTIYLKNAQDGCLEYGYDVSLYGLPDETSIIEIEEPTTEEPTEEVEIESAPGSSSKASPTPNVGGGGTTATTRAATATGGSSSSNTSGGRRTRELSGAGMLGLVMLALVWV